MKYHDSYPLLWSGTESDRRRSERAHQRWVQREAVRSQRREAAKPRRALLRLRPV